MRKTLFEKEGLKIFGNNHNAPLIYGYELTDKEKKEYDFLEIEELETSRFFRFKGWTYYLGNFMHVDGKNSPFEDCPIKFDGHAGDSFFSGVLVKFSEDNECVKVYTYYS
jgi:hypothetical protein